MMKKFPRKLGKGSTCSINEAMLSACRAQYCARINGSVLGDLQTRRCVIYDLRKIKWPTICDSRYAMIHEPSTMI